MMRFINWPNNKYNCWLPNGDYTEGDNLVVKNLVGLGIIVLGFIIG